MTVRRWAIAAAVCAAAFGIGFAVAVNSDRVLSDRDGYIRRDPALPTPSVTYVRRPLRPLPTDRWIPPAPLETR